MGHNGFVQVAGVPGLYSFSEANGTGDLADYTTTLACVETGTIIAFPFNAGGGNESGDVTLADQDDVTCTFTNTIIPATLTVFKDIVPNDGNDFNVNITAPGTGSSGDFALGDGDSLQHAGNPGTFTVVETNGTGDLSNYTSSFGNCSGGSGVVDNGTSGEITLAPGDFVSCTFANTLIVPDTVTITLIKDVVPNNGDDFGLEINGPDADDASDANVGDGGSIQVAGGAPGTYDLSETNGTGNLNDYTSTLSCNGGSDFTYNEGDTVGSITLAADDDVTCTFTNTFVDILPEPLGDGLITCDLGAVTPLVRAEGIAELTGDIIIVCHTIPAGAVVDPDGYIEVNVTASLNVSITNNRDFNAGFQDDTTDAVLVINENNCGAPTDRGARMDALGVTDSGFEAGCSPPDSRFQDPQFGVLVTNNRLEWTGVQVPVPGFEEFPEWTTIRLTSMRGNASELGIPDVGAPAFAQIQATVTINGESAITLNKNEANIGLPLLGLISSVDEAASGLQCEDEGDHATLTINEGFPTAFKTIGTASFTISGSIQVENGYPAPDSGTTTAAGDGGATEGGATQSTHFLLTFFNIPEGVRVGVEDNPDCTEDDLDSDHLVLDAVDCDVNGDNCGGASPISDADDPLFEAGGTVEVSIAGGSGWIGYEVIDDWTTASEDCEIDIWFAWTPDTENDLPAPGTGQLAVSFAPLSTVGTSSEDTEPVPRFLDGSGSDPENIVTVVRCTSTILFPYVTNQQGFDTGLVISNTSEDWLGTQPQDGACEIHYHGETTGGGAAPPTDPSAVVLAGDQLVWLLSSGNAAMDLDPAMEFQGYVIAVCDFQYGHGYAFISDGFGAIPRLAQGYLALILNVDDESVRALVDGVEALEQ